MENTATRVSTSAVAIRYGILTGLVSTIISFVLNMTGLEQSPAKWLTTVVLIVGIVLAHNFFKQQNGGFLAYGQGLGIGTILSSIVGVIGAIFTYIYIHFIDTGFTARVLDKARTDMETQGKMTDAQIDQAMVWTAKFMTDSMLVAIVVLATVLTDFLASLVISAVTKNPRPEFE